MDVKMFKFGSDYCAMSKLISVNLTQFDLIQKFHCPVRGIYQGLQNKHMINRLNLHVLKVSPVFPLELNGFINVFA